MSFAYAEVIGDPVIHSQSPAIHRFWLEKLGLEGDYRPFQVSSAALPSYFAARRDDPDWRGCNVTMPHKIAVLDRLDSLDPAARRIGAVNLVTRKRGAGLHGGNSDAGAVRDLLIKMIGPGWEDQQACASIIGAGGAARAALFGAMDAGIRQFRIFNRTLDKTHLLAAAAGDCATAYPLGRFAPVADGGVRQHVVINASSLGMAGHDPLPVTLADFPPGTIVFDMVYVPHRTALLVQAGGLGFRTIDGIEMLIEQAAASFGSFFGTPPPRKHDHQLRHRLTS